MKAGTKDLRVRPGEKGLRVRAGTLQSIRRFFIGRDYLEVETPLLIPAPAPEVHIDAMNAGNGFLHTSPELCMKRLLSSGYPRIFQICKCFREGERGNLHLPEFTLLEWYRAGCDYTYLMDECEEMIVSIASELGLGETLEYRGRRIDLKRPWERMSISEAFDRYSPIPLGSAIETDRFDEIMVEAIEPGLNRIRPVFLYDYPASQAALARLKPDDPAWAERFELYLGDLELANAFSELTDVREQAERFKRDMNTRKKLGKKGYALPEKFLDALHTMPPSAGIALGVDRLVMVFSNTSKIDAVVSFTPEEL